MVSSSSINKYIEGELDSFTRQNLKNNNEYNKSTHYRIIDGEEQMVSSLYSGYGMLGNIIHLENYYYEDGEIISSIYEINEYNRDNLITSKYTTETIGYETIYTKYSYDYLYGPYALPTDCKIYNEEENNALVEHHVYTYNSSYLLESDTKYLVFNQIEKKETRCTYEYDLVTGLKISEDVYLYNNNVESHFSHETWEYNSNNNLTRRVLERLEENTSEEELFEYDSKNRNTKHSLSSIDVNGNKTLDSLFEYEYYKDTNEYSREESIYYSNGKVQNWFLMFYEFGCNDMRIKGTGAEIDDARGIDSTNVVLEYIYRNDIIHTLTITEGQSPTLFTDGYYDCFKCEKCGNYFTGVDHQEEIGDELRYEYWKTTEGNIPKLSKQTNGFVVGICLVVVGVSCVACLLIIKKKKTKKVTDISK